MDFLGFHHRLVRSRAVHGKAAFVFLARWPADKAMQHARDRIRELTDRSQAAAARRGGRGGAQRVPARLGGYFRYGHSAERFGKIREFTRMRLALFIGKRHKRSRGFRLVAWWRTHHRTIWA